MQEKSTKGVARLAWIGRGFCFIAILAAALVEWRDGAVTRLISGALNQGLGSPQTAEAEGHALLLVDAPSYIRPLSADDGALARVMAAMLARGETGRIAWRLPSHLAPVTVCGTHADSALPYEVVNRRDGAVLVLVPPGAFAMGADASVTDALRIERPLHMVTLPPYYIGKTEVTRSRYERFCRATGRRRISGRMERYCPSGDHPIVAVTLDDARAYCAWAGADLPTEAQWEKAARGTDGRAYPWGDEAPVVSRANFGRLRQVFGRDLEESYRPCPAGSFPDGASPYGALDMAGNVYEWCRDLFDPDYYKKSPAFHPTGAAESKYYVVRGGCWSSNAASIRTFSRAKRYRQEVADPRTGFRVVINVPAEVRPLDACDGGSAAGADCARLQGDGANRSFPDETLKVRP